MKFSQKRNEEAMPEESDNKAKLSDKEERFCYEYLIDLNATQAAIRSGYSKRTARTIASENLTKLDIQQRISEMRANLEQTSGISSLKVILEHKKIAFSDAGQLREGWMTLKDFEQLTDEQKACIQEVKTKQSNRITDEGDIVIDEWVSLKLYNKQASLDSISNILGFNAPFKTDNKIEMQVKPMTKAEARAILKELEDE